MLPDIFAAQSFINYVGSNYTKYIAAFNTQDPSTAIFQLNQLQSFLNTANLNTGVYDPSPAAFGLSYNNATQTFTVNQGTFKYSLTNYVIPPTNFKAAPLWNSTYSGSNYYIASIYINVGSLANSGKILSFTLAQSTLPGQSYIYVNEISQMSNINPPCQLQIGTQSIQIGTFNLFNGQMIFSPGSSAITQSLPAGTKVFIQTQPSISCVYTQPFSDTSSQVYLANHVNAALVPSFSYRLYDILMANPNAPTVVTANGVQQIKPNFYNYAQYVNDLPGLANAAFTGAATNLAASISTFNSQAQQAQRIFSIQNLLNAFTTATYQINSSYSTSNFWLNTIMVQPEISSLGVDLGRYKKFDFTNQYLEANYDLFGGQLYELLYAFDPQYYSYTNTYSNNYQIPYLTPNILNNYGPNSTSIPSSIVYGITAVANSSYPSSETPATYSSNIYSTSYSNVGFNITFPSLNQSSFPYVNIYRKSIVNNLNVDLMISSPYEVQGETLFGTKYMPQSPTSVLQNFTGPFTGSKILDLGGSISKFALQFVPILSTGSSSTTSYVGGVEMYMYATGSYTGSSSIQALLVQPNPTLSSYITVGTSQLMPASILTTVPTNYSFKFYQNSTGSLNLTTGSNYYVVLQVNNFDNNNFGVYGLSTPAAGASLAQAYTGSWGPVTGSAYNFSTLGYVDDLASSTTLINPVYPQSSYIFRGIRQIRNTLTRPRNIYAYVPYFVLDANGNNVATTTANDMLVRVVAYNSTSGQSYDTGYVTIPAGTPSGTKTLLTTTNIVVDTIVYAQILPGANIQTDLNNNIIWGTYDYLLIIGDT